jgi:Fe-S-cluster containining protein
MTIILLVRHGHVEGIKPERFRGRADLARCAALKGKVGEATACTIYARRPEVCRTCMPGDAECAMARRKWGLPVLV